MTGAAKYPIHSDVLNSAALKAVFSVKGNYLLPQAYPVGSPLHPSYPAAHAATAGAGITVLKALFNEFIRDSESGYALRRRVVRDAVHGHLTDRWWRAE